MREEAASLVLAGERQRALSRKYEIGRYAVQSRVKEPVILRTRERKAAEILAEYKYK